MRNQFIQKIIPEYLVCTELWDGYSRRDQDGNESELCYFTETGYHAKILMRTNAGYLQEDWK